MSDGYDMYWNDHFVSYIMSANIPSVKSIYATERDLRELENTDSHMQNLLLKSSHLTSVSYGLISMTDCFIYFYAQKAKSRFKQINYDFSQLMQLTVQVHASNKELGALSTKDQ